MSNKVGYVYDPYMAMHEHPYEDHPECPERIHEIYKELLNRGYIQRMRPIKSRSAKKEEIFLCHNKEHVEFMFMIEPTKFSHVYNSIYANEYSLSCALLAAGSAIELTKNILEKKITSGVAIIRPPGHHATRDEAMGFCFLNNIALGAIYARNAGKKVAVVDFDIHFGNASVDILKGEKDINFFSIHRFDNGRFYYGSGDPTESEGNIFNYPINNIPNCGDKEYLEIFNTKIIPKLKELNPDIILVSAGFDAARGDPLGGYDVTPEGYGEFIRLMKGVCPHLCLMLEGGYNLKSISKSMAECVKVLLEKELDEIKSLKLD